jgi:hypothetical protein
MIEAEMRCNCCGDLVLSKMFVDPNMTIERVQGMLENYVQLEGFNEHAEILIRTRFVREAKQDA